MTEPLVSPDNPLVKQLRQLHRAEGRREQGAFLVEGERAIGAFLDAGWRPKLLLADNAAALPTGWTEAAARRMSARVAAKLSQATTPSGYLAEFAIPPQPTPDPAAGGLVLAGVADPGNVGTLIRSAAAFAISQVVLLGGADPYAHKVVQASAGALAAVRLLVLTEDAGLAPLAGGAPRCALVVKDGSPPERLARRPRWLVVGSEAHGLRPEWLGQCEERLALPMPGAVDSLNAAVAGSIACYLLMG